jgi:hypothetical protein
MQLKEITIACAPEAWRRAGFRVVEDTVQIGRGVRIRLTGKGDGQVVRFRLGVSGETEQRSLVLNGMNIDIEGLDRNLPSDPGVHPNSVCMVTKVVILAADFDATVAMLRAEMPGLDTVLVEGITPDGIPFILWDIDNIEEGLQVATLDPNQRGDCMGALMFTVEDLDAAIATVGQDNLSPKQDYNGRDLVLFQPDSGVSPGASLVGGRSGFV